jgi:hypothetical protein
VEEIDRDLNFKYYPSVCLEGRRRKTTKNLRQDSRFPGRDLKQRHLEYKKKVLTTQP